MTNSINSQGNVPEKTDEVGFCKPPRHTQWKKGQSGNPKGRKKREQARNFHDAMVAELSKTMAVADADGKTVHLNRLELLSNQITNNAIKGDKTALGILMKFISNIRLPEPERPKTPEELKNEEATKALSRMFRAALCKYNDIRKATEKFMEFLRVYPPSEE